MTKVDWISASMSRSTCMHDLSRSKCSDAIWKDVRRLAESLKIETQVFIKVPLLSSIAHSIRGQNTRSRCIIIIFHQHSFKVFHREPLAQDKRFHTAVEVACKHLLLGGGDVMAITFFRYMINVQTLKQL
jgi:hypothetical protein